MFQTFEMPPVGDGGGVAPIGPFTLVDYGATYDQIVDAMKIQKRLAVTRIPAEAGDSAVNVECTTITRGNDWLRLTFKSSAVIYCFDSTTGWSYEKIAGDDYVIPKTGIPMGDLSDEVKNTLNDAVEIPAPALEDGGKVLTAYETGAYGWEELPASSGLPEVTSSDAGKILQVKSNGMKPPTYRWEVVNPGYASAPVELASIDLYSDISTGASGETEILSDLIVNAITLRQPYVTLLLWEDNPDFALFDPNSGEPEPEEYVLYESIKCGVVSYSLTPTSIGAEEALAAYEITALFAHGGEMYSIMFTGNMDDPNNRVNFTIDKI